MTIVVVGAGRIGSHLAKLLANSDRQVTVIDRDRSKLQKLEEQAQVTLIHGDGADPNILGKAGIKRADVLISTTGDDEDNIVICQLAKHEFGVRQVVSIVNNPANSWLFEPATGIDVAVDVTEVLAKLIEERLSVRDIVTLLKLKRQLELVELTVGENSPAKGKTLSEIALPAECVIVGVIRGEDIVIPSGGTMLNGGDDILAITRPASEKDLRAVIYGT